MAYDAAAELKRVRDYYQGDPLQKRFSALITGETNAGKTYILRTARRPIHIDSFDPGGTKCLSDLIASGDVIADTTWENDDPFDPKALPRQRYHFWRGCNELWSRREVSRWRGSSDAPRLQPTKSAHDQLSP